MKFIHTADWQIGMRFPRAGQNAAALRAARLDTVARIVDVANERGVDFMLVAGDLFDTMTPGAGDVGRVAQALKSVNAPVFVLPGNHDPAGAAGPYAGAIWSALAGSNVVTLSTEGVHPVPGGALLAAPCLAKYSAEDPTVWFASPETAADAIRIGIAHGSLQLGDIARTRPGDIRGHFPIDPSAARNGRLSYLALGDWHSYREFSSDQTLTVYSGTPEQTSFGEEDAGSVAVVTIMGPSAKPEVERVRVGRFRWIAEEYDVSDDASVARFNTALMKIESPRNTLVRATLRGLCAPSAAEQLRGLEAAFLARFFSFELEHRYAKRPDSEKGWLELVPPEFSELVRQLIADADAGGDRAAVAVCALDKLAELAR